MAEITEYHFEGSVNDDPKKKFQRIVMQLGSRKIGGLVLTLLLVIALPVTLIAVQQRQVLKQHAYGGECTSTVLPPNGQAGKNPFTNQLFNPSAAVMNGNHVYVFLIGEGEIPSKPFGDWYNLFVIDGTIDDTGNINWTDYDGTIFRNMGGILSSAVRTYVDSSGIHVYVAGYNYQTRTPEGEYTNVIDVNNSIRGWTGFDGHQDSASENADISAMGREYRFTTNGGPLAGCMLGSAPEQSGRRNVSDRADEVVGNQVKLLYVIPSDGEDREYDLNGMIQVSVASIQKWLYLRGSFQQLKFDTSGGALDIGFIRLQKTDQEIKGSPNAYGGIHQRILDEISKSGYNSGEKPNKKYAIYYDGDSGLACGDAYVGGIAGIIYLKKGQCATVPLENIPGRTAGWMDLELLHEIFHSLGAVADNAPHGRGGHIGKIDYGRNSGYEEDSYTQSADLMCGVPTYSACSFQTLDKNYDDYFQITDPNITDVLKSGFFYKGALQGLLCSPFEDVCDYNEETRKAISCLSEKYGVVKGYTNGKFGGDDAINRGTYVAFLVRYKKDVLKQQDWIDDFNSIDSYYDNLPAANSSAPFGQKKFSDVDKSYSLWKEIYLSQKKGFILGNTDGEFKPNIKWYYGFHGVARDDVFRGTKYDFSNPTQQDIEGISRASFITKLYQYSLDNYRDKLSQCSL